VSLIFQGDTIDRKVLDALKDVISIVPPEHHLYVLFSLECVVKQKEQLFEEQKTLFSALLQAASDVVNKAVF